MRKQLCIGVVLAILLAGCSAPAQTSLPEAPPDLGVYGCQSYGVYEFTFSAEKLSGDSTEEWDFVYTYKGGEIQSGYQFLYSPEVFSFHSIEVKVTQRKAPGNSWCAVFPVAIFDGGSGKTEITVTDRAGNRAVFRISCQVAQVGKQ